MRQVDAKGVYSATIAEAKVTIPYLQMVCEFTLVLQAPESLINSEYSSKTDVWAFGILLHGAPLVELVCRLTAFGSEIFGDLESDLPEGSLSELAKKRQLTNHTIKPLPDTCPKVLRDLRARCLQHVPEKRPTTEELLAVVKRWREELHSSGHRTDDVLPKPATTKVS